MDSSSPPSAEYSNPPSFRAPRKLAPLPPDFPVPKMANIALRSTTESKPLVLPRRVSPLQRAQEVTQANAEARRGNSALKSADLLLSNNTAALPDPRIAALEKAVAQLEAKIGEQELALAGTENKLIERDRELAESEALLQAREKVLDAVRKQPTGSLNSGIHSAEIGAWTRLKEELDRQEIALKEQRLALKERENFIQQSEAALLRKIQAQLE